MSPEVRLDPTTVAATLQRTVSQVGAQEAYVGPGDRVTWVRMAEVTRRTAAALNAAGVRKGDQIGVLLGNSAAWIQTFHGITRLGAVTVPVNRS